MLSPLRLVRRLTAALHRHTSTVAAAAAAAAGTGTGLKGHFDFKHLKATAAEMEQVIAKRQCDGDVHEVVRLYDAFRDQAFEVDRMRSWRGKVAQRIAEVQVQGGGVGGGGSTTTPMSIEDALASSDLAQLNEHGKRIKQALVDMEEELTRASERLNTAALKLPNRLHPDVPLDKPVVVYTGGTKTSEAARDHMAIASSLGGLVDFENAAKVTGSGYYYLTGAAALLELALVQYAMNRAVARGFQPVLTPDLVYRRVAEGAGYQPRGEASQVYNIEGKEDETNKLCLVGTAEIPLAGMYVDQILAPEVLPIRMVAFSHCFRREIGSHNGLYRVHQFSKVELFGITRPSESAALLDEIVGLQKEMFEELGLHFEVLNMPANDLGASAYRKYDIEAWMPGKNAYGEISSASDCTDYQSRRLNIRYRPVPKAPSEFVHTVNGTACAIPRMIISLLETHQRPDGSVVLPAALKPFLGGSLPDVLVPPPPPSKTAGKRKK